MNRRANRFFDWLAPLSAYRAFALLVIDLLGTLLAFSAAVALSFVFNPDFNTEAATDKYWLALAITLLLQPFVFDTLGLYRPWRGDSPIREIMRALSAWLALLLIMVLLAALTKTTASYSRAWFILWALLGAVWVLMAHGSMWALIAAMRHGGLNHKRVLLVGDKASARRVLQGLTQHPDAGFDVVAYCGNHAPEDDPVLRLLPYVGFVQELDSKNLKDIAQIWLVFSSAEHDGLRTALQQLQHLMIPIRLVPDLLSVRLLSAPVSYTAGMTMFDLNVVPVYGVSALVKAVLDRVLAAAALILLLPLFLAIAVGIKYSSRGPIFFRQDREGYNGRVFSIYKFRTMYSQQSPIDHVQQAQRNDPRIFPLGRFLRQSSLDELPQLINIILGDMSLVGPRPHAVQHSETYRPLVEFYGWRQMVKPGLTGWAQIHGYRGETETPEKMRLRVEHDLFYVRNWSLWFDIEILLMTVFKGAFFRNAY